MKGSCRFSSSLTKGGARSVARHPEADRRRAVYLVWDRGPPGLAGDCLGVVQ